MSINKIKNNGVTVWYFDGINQSYFSNAFDHVNSNVNANVNIIWVADPTNKYVNELVEYLKVSEKVSNFKDLANGELNGHDIPLEMYTSLLSDLTAGFTNLEFNDTTKNNQLSDLPAFDDSHIYINEEKYYLAEVISKSLNTLAGNNPKLSRNVELNWEKVLKEKIKLVLLANDKFNSYINEDNKKFINLDALNNDKDILGTITQLR